MPDERNEGLRLTIYLCMLDCLEEGNALIASNRHPWQASTQQGVVHQEATEAAVSIHEGMNGHKLQVHKEPTPTGFPIFEARSREHFP